MAAQGSASRMYADIDPHYEWVQGGDFNTLLLHVVGFKKEELKVQVDSSRILKISGERNVEGNKWCRFQKTFQLQKECKISKVKASFDNGILYIIVPKPSSMHQAPGQDGNATTTATTTGEQDASESNGDYFEENNSHLQTGEDMQQEYNHEQPAWGVARNLIKRKLVILNVVIAVILLALVLVRRYKPANGGNNSDL